MTEYPDGRGTDRDPLTAALRDSLAAHAAHAPNGADLAGRIIAATEREPVRERRRWRAWTLPLVTAGAVAGVAAAVVGVTSYHHPAAAPPAGSGGPVTPQLSVHSSPGLTAPVRTSAPHKSGAALQGVRVLDLTFVSDDTGWALASADCLDGSGRCTALLRTTDGRTWTSTSQTPFNVPGVTGGCRAPCVSNIRFANSDVGYVFGPEALLMTTDGGQSWKPQPGGAVLLESLDGNVLRVTASHTGCPSWCDVAVETSAIGATAWTPATGFPGAQGFGVTLERGSHYAYVLALGHPSGGAEGGGQSDLIRSTDDGRTWTRAGEPCPQAGQEIDSWAVAAGGESRVSVLCTARAGNDHWYVATSSDGGATFEARPGRVPPAAAGGLLTGDPDTVLLAGNDGLARSTDGGRSWQPVAGLSGHVTFLGFESARVGRAVTDGNTIWTTRDGGATWTPATFG